MEVGDEKEALPLVLHLDMLLDVIEKRSPDIAEAFAALATVDGYALRGGNIAADATVGDGAYESGLIELRLTVDGGVRIFAARAQSPRTSHSCEMAAAACAARYARPTITPSTAVVPRLLVSGRLPP